MQERCQLLELPAEIRLLIYEYLYTEDCGPLLILRNDESIQQPFFRWFSHPGTALLKTCRIIYIEAAPIVYSKATFRVQMYIGDGWPQYKYAGPVNSSNPLFKQIRNVDITIHLVDAAHIDPALHRLQLLATAFEESEAELESLKVTFKAVTSYHMIVTRDLVASHRHAALRRLGEQYRAGLEGDRLYRKMLIEGHIVSVN